METTFSNPSKCAFYYQIITSNETHMMVIIHHKGQILNEYIYALPLIDYNVTMSKLNICHWLDSYQCHSLFNYFLSSMWIMRNTPNTSKSLEIWKFGIENYSFVETQSKCWKYDIHFKHVSGLSHYTRFTIFMLLKSIASIRFW